jgi:NRPS condensation-like uncharacterized protein
METLFPLAPFEQYMLLDDRAEYPMVFYIRLKFRGSLDRVCFTAALNRATGRHPLLQSIVREIDGAPSWASAADPTPYLSWDSAEQPIDRTSAGPNDLKERTGLRVWVREDARLTSALLEFHHVCCDGVAAMQFVEDLLTAYANELTAATPTNCAGSIIPLRPLAPERLRDRARFGLNFLGRVLRAPTAVFAAVGLTEFFVNRPAAVAIPNSEPDIAAPQHDRAQEGPATVSYRFSQAKVDELRQLAHRLGVTVNDLLIRDLLCSIEDWNKRHDPNSAACVRVSMPVNLRLQTDNQLPATNVVSMILIDRKPRRCWSPRSMLRSIRLDTWIVKRFRMGLAFNGVLALLARFHGALAGLLVTDRCMASAVLSNLGPQLDSAPLPRRQGRIALGATTLDDIEFCPPIRPLTRMAMGVVTYGGELTLTLQYDAKCFTPAMARSFLAGYTELVLGTSTGRRDYSPAPALNPQPAPLWKLRGLQPRAATTVVMSSVAK